MLKTENWHIRLCNQQMIIFSYLLNMRQNDIVFRDYEPGSVFKIGGKEYVLNEDRKLDIPYGADIYDIEYPPMSRK